MFGWPPRSAPMQQPTAFDPTTYSAQLQTKLASLQDLVHTNITANAQQQKLCYDKHSHVRSFAPGDLVWLSVPMRGKLQPKWQGKWKVTEVKNPINVKITDGQTTKVVHVNRLQHRKQPQHDTVPPSDTYTYTNWVPPQIDHHVFPVFPPERRYPQRTR